MRRVVVVGATGQLGRAVVRAFEKAGACPIGLGHREIECADPASVAEAILPLHPEVVVNCAAYVRVDECEDRPEVAFRVNALGALHIARVCQEAQARCVYLSTDYVFDGGKPDPYREEDPPNPINVYGTSKLAGEHLVRQTCPDALVVRVASLFGGSGARGKGGNFVLSVLERARCGERLQVVADVRMSPTYTVDVASALVTLVCQGAVGVFHVVNEGSCTWYDLACRILALAGYRVPVQPIPQNAYPTRARRPANSALSTAKLKAWGIRMRPWEEALAEYLADLRTSGIPLPDKGGGKQEERGGIP
ncbi:MAG: dTDP-4-dehydrorhamnose reductase [Armatimonadetes bacterium]|nr:dTDP-4-dehydrorhamnose reductase [Armatimonadota bacterium]MDW8153474.1 dTDP-4-dehydrorhamnose reductase [Armatimonadota bacterium]